MKIKISKNPGLKVNAYVKAGGFGNTNHNRSGLKVNTGLRAGLTHARNHNARLLSA